MSTAAMEKLSLVIANAGEKEAEAPLQGAYPGIPMPVYHRWPGASNSRMTKLRQSPAHLKAYMDEPSPDAAHFALGRALHTSVLEPEDFQTRYLVASRCTATKKGDGLRCSNDGTVYANGEWLCGVHGKGIGAGDGRLIVLPSADHKAVLGMQRSILAHPRAAKLLSGKGMNELSLFWYDENGVACKARPDRYSAWIPGGAIVDVKSTRDASPRAFERAIYEYGYHRQGAHYLKGAKACGLQAEHFVIIAVEKEPPYGVALYRLSEADLDAGDAQLRPLIAKYGECVAKNEWPGYPTDIIDSHLPDYAWSQIEREVTEKAS